jgi:alpha-beta hydrolase superfamily lysophospholipase
LRTTAKCDTTQKDSNPNLFVFAYDWRKSNEKNAVALKDYVGCVQQFYSGTKVNILAHSMGGLLARRYILDNPGTHNVDKLITIASPWLGARKDSCFRNRKVSSSNSVVSSCRHT